MAYANEGIDQRAEVALDATDSLIYWPKVDGQNASVDPGTAFVTVYDPNGGTLVARTTATISSGRLSYSRSWAQPTSYLAEDWYAVWEWQTGGIAYADRQSFDVVRRKLQILISARDLEDVYPNILGALASIGQTDADRFCRSAWSELLDRIRSAGKRPSLIMERERLINPARHLALAYACEALSLSTGDLWNERAKKHDDKFDSLYAGLGTLRYDADETDTTAPTEKSPVNRRRFLGP